MLATQFNSKNNMWSPKYYTPLLTERPKNCLNYPTVVSGRGKGSVPMGVGRDAFC